VHIWTVLCTQVPSLLVGWLAGTRYYTSIMARKVGLVR